MDEKRFLLSQGADEVTVTISPPRYNPDGNGGVFLSNEAYTLSFKALDMFRLMPDVYLVTDESKEWRTSFLEREVNGMQCPGNNLPIVIEELKNLRTHIGTQHSSYSRITDTIRKKVVSRTMLAELYRSTPDLMLEFCPRTLSFRDNNLVDWELVQVGRSIEGLHDVYDLTVENTGYFATINGFLV